MTGPIELVIVRHGESIRNYSCDLAREGQPEMLEVQMREEQDEAAWPLTRYGHDQAATAGEWIRRNLDLRFDAAYVSPFLRARETAEDLALNLDWKIDERLREREWGDYCAPGYPTYTVDAYLADLAVCANLTWKTPFPGGESVMDMVPRASDFIRDVLRATPSGRIALVTHGGTIRALQVVLEHIASGESLCPDRRLSNCCVVIYRLSEVDAERLAWRGEVRTAHPALPGAPETEWETVGCAPNATS